MTTLIKVGEWVESEIYARRVEHAKSAIDDGSWKHNYEGIAVQEEMQQFLTELSKAMPKVKLIPYNDTRVTENVQNEDGQMGYKSYYLMKSFLVCTDDYPFALGFVSYGDHAVDRSDDFTYAVLSRKIENPKYACHREQHNMMMSKDMKKAIKLAKTYLTPYTTHELATAMYDPIHDNTQRELHRTQRQMRDTLDPVIHNHEIIIAELLNMIRQGVEFSTPQFRDIAKCLQDRVEVYKEQADRQVSALFVRLYNIGEDTYADVKEATDVRRNSMGKSALKDTETKTYALSELPEDITHSIASLNILNNNQYVTNVGMKVDDRHFWVERG